jgi:pantetheine-phosphate adenylyltransferase
MDNTQFISGTLVREIRRLGGDVSPFVSPLVLKALNAKYETNQK